MPFVWIRTKYQWKTGNQAEELIEKIPTIVAEALSVPGTEGELTPQEIEVKVELFGPQDVHSKDVEIIILANDYPERKKNLDERREIIVKKVKEFIAPDFTGFVWVLLVPASFGEF